MSGMQHNDVKRQHLLERLLDAVKQCQIRFGGRKEIASDSDSRVICLCAQLEAVLHHGLRKTKGLALTAAAIKQVAGFSSKTESESSFWLYVKELLNKHELQRFYSLKNINTEVGRGRAWLRCALNEHSLERYLHTLLADRIRLSVFYEDWAFIMDEERSSMLPTMAAGLNSILFAINIDNADLNGQSRSASSMSLLLKESTQGVSTLWKESAQGVSSLLREITTATSTVPSLISRSENELDPLPVIPRSASAENRIKKERKKKKKITNIISFDDEDEGGDEEESLGTKGTSRTSSEEMSDRNNPSPSHNGSSGDGEGWWRSHTSNGEWTDVKNATNGEEDEEKFGRSFISGDLEEDASPVQQLGVENLSSFSTWSPLQVISDNDSSDMLIPVSITGSLSQPEIPGYQEEDLTAVSVEIAQKQSDTQYSLKPTTMMQDNYINATLPSSVLSESMTIAELRQAIMAMMNRKDELEEENSSLRGLLDGEMEHSAALRQELDSLKRKLGELDERHVGKVQALGRENEVLKVQLKKYVGAVQMLKREGAQANNGLPVLRNCDGEAVIPEPKVTDANEDLAASYERKLIEVAEMHGELIEFNERLYRSLMAKDQLIAQMRQELIDLRGPVPGDLSQTSEDPSLSDFEITHRALINVWIPSVFLRGRAANAFHVYQVYIRILDNEWNVYRRYADFHSLHHKLRSRFPQVNAFHFPPKKAIGNKDAKFVEERRKQLQSYMRSVMNKVIQGLPEFTAKPTKETLVRLLPFCM
ncbi:sorting nexin-29 isoform X2 [Polypterus senegalus]|uniref:sorting nexin-29 isoform X2 n=1 Tax=Polypterus senegalus TaxID=55291 RepID=UPI001963D557|nr:sorting nexin-29 isoform X2 [Polypterus senegalus]